MSERIAAENSLLANEIKCLVATSALGMGFDKPDLGFIVHLGVPAVAGRLLPADRPGRPGRRPGRRHRAARPRGRRHLGLLRLAGVPARARSSGPTLAALTEAGRPLSTAALETRVDLTRSRLEMMLKVLDVDGAARRVSGGWTATGQDWAYDADRYARVAGERAREQQAMLGYLETAGCRMEYLRRELDDPGAQPCGRCDNCTGRPWPAAGVAGRAAAARRAPAAARHPVAPRLMWPSGMSELGVPVSGRIAGAVPGPPRPRGGRPDRPGLGRPAARAPASPARAAPIGRSRRTWSAAVVKVLAAWDWDDRPAAW